jgi:hypothetical protein
MRAFTAEELLAAWESGSDRPPLSRALALLSVAIEDVAPADVAALPIGVRNAHLLALRASLFGPAFSGIAECPQCGCEAEFELDALPLKPAVTYPSDEDTCCETPAGPMHFRLPTSQDLLSLDPEVDPSEAREWLFKRCVRDGTFPTDDLDLRAAVQDAIVARMAELDPNGAISLELDCPQCGNRWRAQLDLPSYLCAEVAGWARRLLHEIHVLASAYGWAEADILALSPVRRRAYLELLGM